MAHETDAAMFAERLRDSALGMMDILSVNLGDRLGLYRAFGRDQWLDPSELAQRADVHPRYAREWLEQQAASGILVVEDAAEAADDRRYALPAPHADVLTDPENPLSMAPAARSLVACAAVMPALLEAFRTGGGVPWEAYGRDMVEAQADSNRPWLTGSFASEHLPRIPDVHARLLAHPPARVADVACGGGWASIALARAYPKVTVLGVDLDPSSIALATRHADTEGVGDRVRFEVRDAADPALEGGFDVVLMVEALHDLSRPVQALAAMRTMLSPGGTALVVDERTSDTFTAPAGPVDRLHYGYSVLCCLPAAMTDPDSAATGTVMRPATLDAYARAAGFGGIQSLDDIELESLRHYRLLPAETAVPAASDVRSAKRR
jgi:SAM-dependent methyltransferase